MTISGNDSGGFPGGGLHIDDNGGTVDVTLRNVTIGPNTAGSALGMWLEEDTGSSTLTVENAIFSSSCAILGTPTINDGGVSGGNIRTTGNGCPGSDAATNGLLLSALADNGGFTQTIAIGATSDALNFGTGPGCPATDQRGLTRALGGVCDSGAYERTASNGPPVISTIPTQVISEDDSTTGPIEFLIADSDTPAAAGLTVSISGNTSTVVPTGSITLLGAAESSALRGVPDTDENGSGTVTVQVSDGSATATSPFTLTVNAVNDAPVYSAVSNPAASNEDAGAQSVPSFVTSSATGPVAAVVFDESAQSLTGFTATITGTTGGLTFSSAPAVSGIGTLSYQASPDSTGTATISLTLGDNGGTANGGVNVSAAQTFTITVDGANDAPQFTLGGNPPAVNEDAGAQVVAGFATNVRPGPLTATDETGQGLTFTPTITGTTGGLTFSSAPVVNEGTGNLFYTASPGSSGTATIDLTLTDNGSNVAPNVNVSGVQTFTITVNAGNDPPVNTVPGLQTTPANTALVFSTANSNAISFTDPDAGAATNVQVTLSLPAGVGVLSPGPTGTAPPLTSVTGVGTNTLQMVGGATALNSALQGLTLTPQTDVTGVTTLTVTTNDAGATGGGALQDVDTVQINVGNLPTLSINDRSVTEGDSGASNTAQFTVTLAPASNLTVTVQYTTVNGTATGGASCTGSTDFQTQAGALTFAPTETSKTVTVPVCGDAVIEADETFRVDLSTPVNAAILDGQGTGTIQNDDVAGAISFTAATATAQENGGSVTVTVQRSGGAASGITVQYGTGDVTAQAGQDYTATTGTLTFGAGESTRTVTVPIRDDSNTEPAETFTVTLANPQGGATLGTPAVITVTIVDTSVPASPLQGQDDTDPSRKNTQESKDVKETQEQQQQRERTNRGNRDDIATEGNVTEVHLDANPPYVVLGNRDGAVRINLLCGDQCPVIRVGDYIEVDGEKQHEQLYDAEQVTVRK